MSVRQNNKKRKGRNSFNNRERTFTTLTGAEDLSPTNQFAVATSSAEDLASTNVMSSPFSVTSSSGGNQNNPASLMSSNFGFAPYNSYMSAVHHHQQQPPHQFYPVSQQPKLPAGDNDLEILERLKEMIKSGQHEFYRAIPQPAALASIYLGPNTTHPQSQVPHHPEQTLSEPQKITSSSHYPGGRNAFDGLPQDASLGHDASGTLTSPMDQERRPPRMQNKDTWDLSSTRNKFGSVNLHLTSTTQSTDSVSKIEEVSSAGVKPGTDSVNQPSISSGHADEGATFPPHLSKQGSLGSVGHQAPLSPHKADRDHPRPLSDRLGLGDHRGYDRDHERNLSGEHGSPNKAPFYHDGKPDDRGWRDSHDQRPHRDRDMDLPARAGTPSTNGNGPPDRATLPANRDQRFHYDRDRDREHERDFRDARDIERERERDREPVRDRERDRSWERPSTWDRDKDRDRRWNYNHNYPRYDRVRDSRPSLRPPPELRHYEPDYDGRGRRYSPPMPAQTGKPGPTDQTERSGQAEPHSAPPPSATGDERASRVAPTAEPTADRSPAGTSATESRTATRAPTGEDRRPTAVSLSEDRRLPPASTGDIRSGLTRSVDIPSSRQSEEEGLIPLEDRISHPPPSLQERLSQPPSRIPPASRADDIRAPPPRQPSLEERISHPPPTERLTRPPSAAGHPYDRNRDRDQDRDRPPTVPTSRTDEPRTEDRPPVVRAPDRYRPVSPDRDRDRAPLSRPVGYTKPQRASSVVRDEPRLAPPARMSSSPPPRRDFRAAPPPLIGRRELSRERTDFRANNYRPDERNYGDDRRGEPMDVDSPRFAENRGTYTRKFSPPSVADLARDRERAREMYPPPNTSLSRGMTAPLPPSDPGPYDDLDRRFGERRDWNTNQGYTDRRREYDADGYWKYGRNGGQPPPLADRPGDRDRDRYDRGLPPPPVSSVRNAGGWELRDERERRATYPGEPPARPYDPPRSLGSRITDGYPPAGSDSRSSYPPPPPRDVDRRYPPPPPSGGSPPPFSRVRPRSPSPIGRRPAPEDLRPPPPKRQREDAYVAGYYSQGRDPPGRRPGDYPPRAPSPPPPSTGGSSYYDRRDYPPPPPPSSGYDRPRSPVSRPGGYGRDAYRPGDRDDRRYSVPPPPRTA